MGATNVEFVEGEAEALPFPDESFDVVISNGVIDLIPDKDAVFAELFRVLVPGGRMQIADVTIQRPGQRRRADATSTSGPAELPGRCWKQRTRRSSSATASSGSRHGQLVDTYARSKFEDTRRKAQKFGARGTTLKAFKPR